MRRTPVSTRAAPTNSSPTSPRPRRPMAPRWRTSPGGWTGRGSSRS
ncbi:hypothetical protein [Caudoviricetes sp.]|nr:hypothetical protein [Caudoviricetes sp.]